MVAHGEPILLPGFDRDKQFQYDFKSSKFDTFWLRRVYTQERSHVMKNLGRRKPQEIRYGNNITVLLKACYHLRAFYQHASFWTAVASGFGTMPAEVAKERTFAFMDARLTFLSRGGAPDYISTATRAADDFIAYLDSDSSLHSPLAPAGELKPAAAAFFSGMRESLVDSARMTSEGESHSSLTHNPARLAPQAVPRKRSPSLSPPGQPSSAKRRQFSDTPDRTDMSGQARAPKSLPPLLTGNKNRSITKLESCLTPSTAQDELTPDGYFSQGMLDKPTELKIRGTAAIEKSHSPSQGAPDGAKGQHPLSYEDIRHANIKLQVRVQELEKEKKQREGASKAVDAKFALLEQRMNAIETKPIKDDKLIQDMATKLASLDEQLQEARNELSDKSRAVQELKNSVGCLKKALESKALRPEDTKAFQDLHHVVQSFETRMSAMETKIDAEDKALVTRVAALEKRADTPNKHSCDRNAAFKALVERLERQVTSVEAKVATLETRQGPEIKAGALDGRFNDLQKDIMAVREMVNDQSMLNDLRGDIKRRPTSESVSKQIREVEQLVQGLVETCGKEILKRVNERCKSACVAAVSDFSTRIDKLGEDLDKVNTSLQSVQKVPATVEPAQPSGSTSEVLGRLDELSEIVNGILESEARLTIPPNLDGLVQRVAIVERILRNLRDAY